MRRPIGYLAIVFLLTQLVACGGGGGGGSSAATATPAGGAVTGLTVPAQVPVVTPND
ncbi:MAG: hypothetical protein HZA64_10955 [Rhodocyclales bacterium]|nr:hypothetical protein [Rhodocyclales bacterium]